ncbi:MAG: phosphonate ABC transporter ATP-binding protein [Desulfitobacterium sp.]
MPLLELKRIAKDYSGQVSALREVTFSVEEGEFIAIIGPSGAGKSTLLRCINRMIEPTHGDIYFDGINTLELGRKDLRRLRTRIGMIFQHYNLVNRLTVLENVLHGRLGYKSTLAGMVGLYSKEEQDQALKMLEALGLSEQIYKRCDQLSGGQKQRVGIARALVQNPRMILCDEPIASLDPNASKVIMDHLQGICRNMGITVIVNLHQVQVALQYSDRIIGINQGRVVFDDSPRHLTKEKIQEIYGSEAKDLMINLGGKHAG